MAGQDEDNSNQNDIIENNEIEPADASDDEIDIVDVEELNLLDSKLEELNSALDYLEKKNDDIQHSLKQLLQSNIDMRKEMQKQKEQVERTQDENMETAGNN
ncbi:unnamed protein product [Chrysodeixis includens]|uniref:Uncharacterized protein n=1 Tax=Chrysodeixis includens TaxID=689277 RepID=A0A9P0C227_CHRIL|nr:unnamed protein product [Chrysodeixis includens]